ncbi:MAG: ATP-binding protein [Candidatus Sedimenticola sp. (ex Thyasira tokunagai)]
MEFKNTTHEDPAQGTTVTQGEGTGDQALLRVFRHRKLDAATKVGTEEYEHFPPPPSSWHDLEIDFTLITRLIVKHLLIAGELRIDKLADRLAIPPSLLGEPIHFLRKESLIEAKGEGSDSISGAMHYSLTTQGRDQAGLYMEESAYCGPLPVSLESYRTQIERQSVKRQIVDRQRTDEIFHGLVIRPETITQVGAAFNSGRSAFLFGPAGVGKTFLAHQMLRLLYGNVAIPHAIVTEGQIIRIFDPVNHRPVEAADNTQAPSPNLRKIPHAHDNRWVICRRPVIISGGELNLPMLDLQYQQDTRFYDAPLQMKANGGIFMVDDLGRQACNTAALLNRWVVPLESGVDYLSLHTGGKFQIPFDVLPVFATNLSAADLADDAFIRRLGYKIRIHYLTEEEYRKVFKQYCDANDLTCSEEVIDFLINELYKPSGRPLIACQPRDLINQIIDYCLFEGKAPAVSEALLVQAWRSNFFSEEETEVKND